MSNRKEIAEKLECAEGPRLSLPSIGFDDAAHRHVFSISSVKTEISWLMGRVLTVIDATVQDQTQRKAVKDLMRNAFMDTQRNLEKTMEHTDKELFAAYRREASSSDDIHPITV